MDCRWENFKNSPLQQLADLDLSFNQLSWDQKSFNDQVQRDPEPTTVFRGRGLGTQAGGSGRRTGVSAARRPVPPLTQVASLKEKKLRHLFFAGNPFVDEVEAYRIWTISNNPKLIDLDGHKVLAPYAPHPLRPSCDSCSVKSPHKLHVPSRSPPLRSVAVSRTRLPLWETRGPKEKMRCIWGRSAQ